MGKTVNISTPTLVKGQWVHGSTLGEVHPAISGQEMGLGGGESSHGDNEIASIHMEDGSENVLVGNESEMMVYESRHKEQTDQQLSEMVVRGVFAGGDQSFASLVVPGEQVRRMQYCTHVWYMHIHVTV